MRLGLSHLQHQLYSFNIITDPNCPCCNRNPETPAHYFLFCHKFITHRIILYAELVEIIPDTLWTVDDNTLTDILLKGSSDFALETNVQIFQTVQKYIRNTQRFVRTN